MLGLSILSELHLEEVVKDYRVHVPFVFQFFLSCIFCCARTRGAMVCATLSILSELHHELLGMDEKLLTKLSILSELHPTYVVGGTMRSLFTLSILSELHHYYT